MLIGDYSVSLVGVVNCYSYSLFHMNSPVRKQTFKIGADVSKNVSQKGNRIHYFELEVSK